MFRALLLAAPLALVPLAASAPTASAATSAAQSRTGEQCQRGNQERRRRGSAIGGFARGLIGRVGGGAVANTILPMGSMLGDAVMSLLDCREQEQAASATETAVQRAERGGAGASSTWRSETRTGVSGTSTVTAVDSGTPDGDCMSVSDVVIVDGQETEVAKRMCRRPPTNRYVRV